MPNASQPRSPQYPTAPLPSSDPSPINSSSHSMVRYHSQSSLSPARSYARTDQKSPHPSIHRSLHNDGSTGLMNHSDRSLPPIEALLSPTQPYGALTSSMPHIKSAAWNSHLHLSPISPPPQPLDPAFVTMETPSSRKQLPLAHLPSPPNSTELPLHHSFGTRDDGSTEPQLYSSELAPAQLANQLPLFAPAETVLESDASTFQKVVSDHIADTSDAFAHAQTSPPSIQDYVFVAHIFKTMRETGVREYIRSEAKYMEQYQVGNFSRPQPRKVLQDTSANRRAMKPLVAKPSTQFRRQSKTLPATTTVTIDTLGATPTAANIAAVTTTSDQAVRAPRARVPTQASLARQDGHPTPRAKTVRPKEEANFEDIPDYAPAWSTMRNGVERAKEIKWLGTNSRIDLSNDPNRHLLSDAELLVASTLRLDCTKYLNQKRRIFRQVVAVLSQGKEFKKTNCQDVRLIDVNKLSALWVFYHSVGWFERHHYQRYF